MSHTEEPCERLAMDDLSYNGTLLNKSHDAVSPSCLSIKSDNSGFRVINFTGDKTCDPSGQLEKSNSLVSLNHVSIKSSASLPQPINFREDRSYDLSTLLDKRHGAISQSSLSMKSDSSASRPINFREDKTCDPSVPLLAENSLLLRENHSMDLTFTVKSTLKRLVNDELKLFKKQLDEDYSEISKGQTEDNNALVTAENLLKSCGEEKALNITLHVLKNINLMDLAVELEKEKEKKISVKRSHQNLKVLLIKKTEQIFEGIAKQGNPSFLVHIYTEVYITEGGNEEADNEHEVRQTETLSKKSDTQETVINCNDIFKPLCGQDIAMKTVVTKGIAGIGKTVSVQKFILDWAEGKANQYVQFMFPLEFRDLNLKKHKKYSLVELLHHYFPEQIAVIGHELHKLKVMFILDGLDECRLHLDFQNNENVYDTTKKTSLDVLLTNLVKGNLLPSALIWITSRPAAASQIPSECVHRVTQIHGFRNPQKEEYFRKRISDQDLAERMISHVKKLRALHIMCHIPIFCWIISTVLGKLSDEHSDEIPTTLTQMYIHFLLIQTNLKNQKYFTTSGNDGKDLLNCDKMIVYKLGELAFHQMEKGHLIFYEEDLKECGIDVDEASVYSGVCTEIFKVEDVMSQKKVYSFVHLSVQEFLAALFVFNTFITKNWNLLTQKKVTMSQRHIFSLHKSAMSQALRSTNGHLDLFLRFLLGISLDSSQALLQCLVTKTKTTSLNFGETVKYIKKKIRSKLPPEKSINLFHCLREVNDNSLVQEIQSYLNSGILDIQTLSHAHWSALVFVLQTSGEIPDVFDLKRYMKSEEALLRLLPVLRLSKKALLKQCNLKARSCKELASTFTSKSLHLKELDLSENDLQDEGIKLLSAGLKNPCCHLEILRLHHCTLKEKSCEVLASVLSSKSSHLRELDLSDNDLQDSGVKLLSAGLRSSSCKLEVLRLDQCNITETCCEEMGFAISSNSSHLRKLDLSDNDIQDSGVKLLCAGLESPQCKLEILRLSLCNLTEGCCKILAKSLSSTGSVLRELDLSNNDLQDSGVKLLTAGLENPQCKLETLRLSGCQITEEACASLASVLKLNTSHLTELDLSYNHPGETGVKLLSVVLEDSRWKLKKLNVNHCGHHRLKSGLQKYACHLTLDPNTAHKQLLLSAENRKVTCEKWEHPYPEHPDRFETFFQVLCNESQSGRSYWEVTWSGCTAYIAVAYKDINRKKEINDCGFGRNNKSWILCCSKDSNYVKHDKVHSDIHVHPSQRVGVYLDWEAGTLSFYRVSCSELTLLYRFHTTFTQPLYPGFRVYYSSVTLV